MYLHDNGGLRVSTNGGELDLLLESLAFGVAAPALDDAGTPDATLPPNGREWIEITDRNGLSSTFASYSLQFLGGSQLTVSSPTGVPTSPLEPTLVYAASCSLEPPP